MYGGRKTAAAVAGRGLRGHDGPAPARLLRGRPDHGDRTSTSNSTSTSSCSRATYDQFFAPGEFPLERLRQAASVESVAAAAPLYSTFNLWRCPPYPPDDPDVARDDERPEPGPLRRWLLGDRLPRPLKRRELLVIGVDLENDPFAGPIRRAIDEAAAAAPGAATA